MKRDYYSEIIIKIKKLIYEDEQKAITKIHEELNMPYIPKIYKQQFVKLLHVLTTKKTHNKINNELSKDEVLEILKSNNTIRIPMALSKLAELNIKAFVSDIEFLFKKTKMSNIILSILYEYCVEQSIDTELEWGKLKINPIKIGSIIKTRPYIKALTIIEKTIQQNPSLKDVSLKLLELYSLLTFPKFINESYGLGEIIIDIAKESLGMPFEFRNSLRRNKIKIILQK